MIKRATGSRCNVRQSNSKGKKSVHAICHIENGGPVGLIPIHPENGIYLSRCWCVGDANPQDMIGGWLYLHDASYEKSYFAAIIMAVQPDANGQNRPGVAFTVKRDLRGKHAGWRGSPAARGDYVRVVEARYTHELT